jgi:RNA polymerase sigma-70 factor (ECF subfamily)
MNPPGPDPAYTSQIAAAPSAADDRELVARMSAGDDTALAQLYDRWSRAIYALVVHLVRDGDDAEDVVEEAFWQAWRQASRYEASRGAVGTWLLTIARSRALDRLRTRRRLREEPLTPVLLGDREASSLGTSSDDPARRAELLERRERVAGALRSLPPEQRQVLELAYFAGLSQTEIADRTGQPLGTVKTRTRLAAQKLRDSLAVLRGVERVGGPSGDA